jgi:hypothetical protein
MKKKAVLLLDDGDIQEITENISDILKQYKSDIKSLEVIKDGTLYITLKADKFSEGMEALLENIAMKWPMIDAIIVDNAKGGVVYKGGNLYRGQNPVIDFESEVLQEFTGVVAFVDGKKAAKQIYKNVNLNLSKLEDIRLGLEEELLEANLDATTIKRINKNINKIIDLASDAGNLAQRSIEAFSKTNEPQKLKQYLTKFKAAVQVK